MISYTSISQLVSYLQRAEPLRQTAASPAGYHNFFVHTIEAKASPDFKPYVAVLGMGVADLLLGGMLGAVSGGVELATSLVQFFIATLAFLYAGNLVLAVAIIQCSGEGKALQHYIVQPCNPWATVYVLEPEVWSLLCMGTFWSKPLWLLTTFFELLQKGYVVGQGISLEDEYVRFWIRTGPRYATVDALAKIRSNLQVDGLNLAVVSLVMPDDMFTRHADATQLSKGEVFDEYAVLHTVRYIAQEVQVGLMAQGFAKLSDFPLSDYVPRIYPRSHNIPGDTPSAEEVALTTLCELAQARIPLFLEKTLLSPADAACKMEQFFDELAQTDAWRGCAQRSICATY